jgi:hypothetical protein
MADCSPFIIGNTNPACGQTNTAQSETSLFIPPAAPPGINGLRVENRRGNTSILGRLGSGSGMSPFLFFAGVWGDAFGGPGVFGATGFGPGVWGVTDPGKAGGFGNVQWDSEAGVVGQSSSSNGVYGRSSSTNGVAGFTNNPNKAAAGVYGENLGAFHPSIGVYGRNTANGIGVYGESVRDGKGVHGESVLGVGVLGRGGVGPDATSRDRSGPGVLGIGPPRWGEWPRVRGEQGGSGGIGVHGHGFFAVRGTPRGTPINGQGPWAGWFEGKVSVNGELNKASGGFRIDHPQDPANRYLNHSFVESNEMKNVYDGVADLDEEGAAWVELPEWFKELNRDFRYQLTVIGGPAPELHIAEEFSEENNSFRIAGGKEGLKVCWQVTGVRKDRWAETNPLTVEQEKLEEDREHYLHPDLYGAPEEQVIGGRLPETPNIDLAPLAEPLRDTEVGRGLEETSRPVEQRREELSRRIEELRRQMEEQVEEGE